MKRENIERRENGVKQRGSVRESRVRGIERKMERWREKKESMEVSLNIPSYTVDWRGTERRGALKPWCQ